MGFKFNNCHTPNNVNCSSGMAGGEITTPNLNFELVYIKGGAKTVGLLGKTGPNGFASFSCGLATVKISGNGMIGQVSSPACGASSAKWKVSYAAPTKEGVQQYQEIEGSSTRYSLEESINGMAASQAAIDMVMEFNLIVTTGELTCP